MTHLVLDVDVTAELDEQTRDAQVSLHHAVHNCVVKRRPAVLKKYKNTVTLKI